MEAVAAAVAAEAAWAPVRLRGRPVCVMDGGRDLGAGPGDLRALSARICGPRACGRSARRAWQGKGCGVGAHSPTVSVYVMHTVLTNDW